MLSILLNTVQIRLVTQLVTDQLKITRVFHKKSYKCFGGATLCDRVSTNLDAPPRVKTII
jgi:hypothetical protein